MRHARPDYDRFQDPENLIPEDEPVFLLRGQDRLAPATIRNYADHVARSSKGGGLSLKQVAEMEKMSQVCYDWAVEMEKWQEQNPEKVKFSDLPKES